MPSIEENKFWDKEYNWSEHGDEWSDQASFCRIPYGEWKKSIVDFFIYPNIKEGATVLEIAPGHGRWTKYILEKAGRVILSELNPGCIDYCKKIFSNFNNVEYFVNDGKSLSFVKSESADFIWSYDSFVHMERDVIEAYFEEFSRVLKKGGFAIIHHANRKDFFLKLGFLRKYGKNWRRFYNLISIGRNVSEDGRSAVSNRIIRNLAERSGFKIEYQINSWGPGNIYNSKCFNDYITKIVKI